MTHQINGWTEIVNEMKKRRDSYADIPTKGFELAEAHREELIHTFNECIDIVEAHQKKNERPYSPDVSEEVNRLRGLVKKVAQCAFNSASQIEGSEGFEHWWQQELKMNDELTQLLNQKQ